MRGPFHTKAESRCCRRSAVVVAAPHVCVCVWVHARVQVVLHASQVNQRTSTYDGIDVCGARLAEEVARVAAAHPTLTRISVIGHSMGGLLVRE